jgi:GntR family transcriptional regulator, arabinose operon transcriptional repressor
LGTPKYERLKQIIHNNIRDGVWKVGDRLPAERVLCDKFGVSKITVKRAKDDLLAEGVLENQPGRKGAFIRPTTRMPATGLIGVAIDDINDPHFSLVLKGIEDKLWENKLHTVLCNAYHNTEKLEAYFHSLLQQRVMGVIFSPARGVKYIENNRRIVEMLARKQIPYVFVDRYVPGLCVNAVVANNYQGSKDLTKSLLEQGHTRILALTGVSCSSMDDRLQGYREALQGAGMTPAPHLIIHSDDILLKEPTQREEEVERIRKLVEKAGEFTACYTMNSLLLQVATQVLFPKDNYFRNSLAIATYDYGIKEVLGFTNRVLVAKQPGYRMGWEAARLLIEILNNPDLPVIHMSLRPTVVEEIIQ